MNVGKFGKMGCSRRTYHYYQTRRKLEFKDVKVTAVESFDRTCLVTLPVDGAKENNDSLKGLAVTDEEMARKAVNYIFETPGGTIYHGADSSFFKLFCKNMVRTSTLTLRLTIMGTTQLAFKTR